jgi:hypothetical protein
MGRVVEPVQYLVVGGMIEDIRLTGIIKRPVPKAARQLYIWLNRPASSDDSDSVSTSTLVIHLSSRLQ